MSKSIHMAMSVDVDRFGDKYLSKNVCPFLTQKNGTHPTPSELRVACAEARRDGLEVLPPCDNTDAATGRCLGHEEPAATRAALAKEPGRG